MSNEGSLYFLTRWMKRANETDNERRNEEGKGRVGVTKRWDIFVA